ncbi:MAG: site-specific integrase [Clostridia bacterium]|nr:site-specific integrase [Clostridia bacterium]
MAVYNEKDKKKWTKDGRHWYYVVTYLDTKGKRKYKYSKMFIDRATAEAEELKFKTKRDNPTLVKFSIVASEYFDYLNKSRKESTAYTYIRDYKCHLMPYFDDFYINNINTQVIREWHEEMDKKGLSVKYLNKINGILINIFNYAIKNYSLEKNVAKEYGYFERKREEVIPDSQKLQYITLEDFNKFISFVDDPLWHTFFIFLFYTGMRKGEVQALTWNDIDFNSNEIVVNKTLSIKTSQDYKITATKNYVNRKIKMSKTLRETLIAYKNECRKYSDFKENWFIFGNTRFLPQTTIDRYKHKYFELSGVREIKIHEFRHSHVSLLINEYIKQCRTKNVKIDIAKFFLMLANRLGHSVETMQKIYMHLLPTVQDEVVDILDNL